MSWYGDDSQCSQNYNDYQTAPKHEAHLSHELLSGAVAYEAAKSYENHVAENGRPDSHAKAKEILAGFVGAGVDREVEKHGLNFIDRERAKRDAQQQAYQGYDQQYCGGGDGGGYQQDSGY